MNAVPPSELELRRGPLQRLPARVRSAVPFGSGVMAALAALLLFNVLFPRPEPLTPQQVSDTVAQALASASPPPVYAAQVYQAIQPSLVLIQTQVTGADGQPASGLGTGVVIDASGNILTALHVVADAADIQLTFADGTQSSAQVAVEQPESDIAVLRPSQLPPELIPATLGNPNALRVGDEVFVVGHPLGLYGSLSAGVISGFNRAIQPVTTEQRLEGLIQIDAAVNPGNSGGPLLNRRGQVVGIVVGLANPTEQDVFAGLGFAVPISIAGAAVDLPQY